MKKVIEASINSKLLAVFWYIDGQFVGAEGTLKDGILYGDYLQLDDDHFEIWDKFNSDKSIEYDYYPRGRIMFNTKIHKFVVVGDCKIVNSYKVKKMLLQYYGLPESTIFEYDEHYQSDCEE